jgi:S-adenosyl methyltransferase
LVFRPRAEIAAFFDGLDLVEPGLEYVNRWPAGYSPPDRRWVLGGVGRKPLSGR